MRKKLTRLSLALAPVAYYLDLPFFYSIDSSWKLVDIACLLSVC